MERVIPLWGESAGKSNRFETATSRRSGSNALDRRLVPARSHYLQFRKKDLRVMKLGDQWPNCLAIRLLGTAISTTESSKR